MRFVGSARLRDRDSSCEARGATREDNGKSRQGGARFWRCGPIDADVDVDVDVDRPSRARAPRATGHRPSAACRRFACVGSRPRPVRGPRVNERRRASGVGVRCRKRDIDIVACRRVLLPTSTADVLKCVPPHPRRSARVLSAEMVGLPRVGSRCPSVSREEEEEEEEEELWSIGRHRAGQMLPPPPNDRENRVKAPTPRGGCGRDGAARQDTTEHTALSLGATSSKLPGDIITNMNTSDLCVSEVYLVPIIPTWVVAAGPNHQPKCLESSVS